MNKTEKISDFMKAYGTVFAGVIIVIAFSILSFDAFFTFGNFINITRQISLLVIIALGATLVMSVEEFDLSIGAMASLGGVVAAKMAVLGAPIILCFAVPVIACFLIGLLNGWVVTRFRVLSFITTLAMSTVIGGFTFWFTGGATIFENIPKGFTFIGTKSLFAMPLLSIIMIVLTVFFWFTMRHTAFGRKLYAIGGNEAASRVSGISVTQHKNIAFALCAALAALTGVLMASRLGSAHPTGGDGLFLQAYAAAFLGRTVFREGVPNIWGTFAGAAILGVLANGLTIMQVPTFMQDLLTGCIIILAVVAQKIGHGGAK
ncbi:MAG TPA: ABC transporter permease [Anaerovoracaceae bacterium]|nr:ABC transporter permease [Anaerovoracaceae bacterium]